MTDDKNLELYCILEGGSGVFCVTVSIDSEIPELVEVVWEKGVNFAMRKTVLAKDLDLWKVNLNMNMFDEKPPNEIAVNDIEGAEKLDTWRSISDYWPSKPTGSPLSIIVQLPHASGLLPTVPLTSKVNNALGNLRLKHAKELGKRSPSSLGQPPEFKDKQSAAGGPAIYCGRPPSAEGTVPVTLLHPIFGQFVDDCHTHIPTKEDNELVASLWRAMSQFYDDVRERRREFLDVLDDFGIVGHREHKTTSVVQLEGINFLIAESRLELGSRGAEPLLQAGLYYNFVMGNLCKQYPHSPLPCIVLYVFGAHIGFAGATFSDRPHLQVLSTTLPLFWHKTDTTLRLTAARHMGALKKAVNSLKHYYKILQAGDALILTNQPDPRFPYRSHFRSLEDSSEQHFKYSSSVPETLVFFGKTDDGNSICVKFVRSYSKDAHLKCAAMGIAPRLRGFEDLPGGWHMVVMDVIGDEYVEFDVLEPPIALYGQINAKLVDLHQAGFVHGDLRDVNVMVRDDGEGFMLLDFDWAGEIGTVRYPMNVYAGWDLIRPDGVEDGKLIAACHDIEMLDIMFRNQ